MTGMSEKRVLVLGSSSRWRRKTLETLGRPFITVAPDIDEKAIRDPDPSRLTVMIAEAKAQAVARMLGDRPAIVLASDQVAVFRGEIREKPRDADEARRFLRGYRHRTVDLVTSVVALDTVNGVSMDEVSVSRVAVGALPDRAIEAAVLRGDVLSSCGALVVEDPSVAPWVEIMEGTQDEIDGLPLDIVRKLLLIHDFDL